VAWRFSSLAARAYYAVAAVWTGLLIYFVLAASACWAIDGIMHIAGFSLDPRRLAEGLFGLALLAGLYGIANANWIRIRQITVPLANLPAAWHGRVAALVSDLHLGHLRNQGFARRVAQKLSRPAPDIVFIAGDLYDGTAADLDGLAHALGGIRAPLGAYYIAGNHEEFGDHTKYLQAVARAGIHVLDDEKITIEGLQIVGIHYRDSVDPDRFRCILQRADLDRAKPSLLVTHAPNNLGVVEAEGIAFQVCGHTHGGQFFPFRWLPKRIYGEFVYGLHRLGRLAVYTSCGVGTWGPPLRVGTAPEIVLIRFASAQTG
jgi:uncharacterized protein